MSSSVELSMKKSFITSGPGLCWTGSKTRMLVSHDAAHLS